MRETPEIAALKPRQSPDRPIDPGVTIGHIHLKVADIDRALAFYCGVLGFELMQRYGTQAAFISAGGYHHHIGLNTWESKGGSPPPRGTTGLYHTRHPLSDAGRAGGCPAPADRGRHSARRRQRPRRQRGALSARSRPERRRALPGQAARGPGRVTPEGELKMVTERLDLDDLMAAAS